MSTVGQLREVLENVAPLHLQESYDNAGLITGHNSMEITGVTVALDSTEAVIDEAIARGHNVVVAHHPIVFSGLKRFNGKNYIERTIIKAIKNDIAIYAIHTNLDNVAQQGVNERIGKQLGMHEMEILATKDMHNPTIGSGMFGYLEQPMASLEFIKHVKQAMQADSVKYTDILKEKVHKIAWCGGSGSFLLEQAKAAECDVFLSSDFKYHQFFDANDEILILDIGHFETEQFTIHLLVDIINENFSNFAAHFTKVNTNPVHYI